MPVFRLRRFWTTSPRTPALALEVRAAVLASAPELTEKGLPGWRAISFRHEVGGFLCAIFPFTEHVDLTFENGVQLDDPYGLLQPGRTSQKQVRSLRFPLGTHPDGDTIDFYVQQAISVRTAAF